MKDRSEQRDAMLNEFFARANEPLCDQIFLRALGAQLAKEERARRLRSIVAIVTTGLIAAASAPLVIGVSERFGDIVARGYPVLTAVIESPIGWVVLAAPALWMIGRTLRT